ncbi:MAG: phosphate signaling complex protein PhoU [Lachnospiraceae bacterium]|nr:phosphate signaling complex protein PhoU [Lachnospiraceae bacterium]
MRNKFDAQLKNLKEEMIRMGVTIEQNIQKAIDAFVRNDILIATDIMQQDAEIDKMQRDIEAICFNLLIQQQPVAKDLREITAAMKMVTDMERIGDHAADISEITIMLADSAQVGNYETILKMAGEASIMLTQSIDAFTGKDKQKAEEVIKHDDVVDKLFDQVKLELIELIKNDPKRGEQEIDMLMIAKYLERIGDHATNIAEWVIYALDNQAGGNRDV